MVGLVAVGTLACGSRDPDPPSSPEVVAARAAAELRKTVGPAPNGASYLALPAVEKVLRLGVDRKQHPDVVVSGGEVRVFHGDQSVVLAQLPLMEPEFDYFIDADGDLVRAHPSGQPWSPPIVAARNLPLATLPAFKGVADIESVRFAKLPFDGATLYESELLAPAAAVRALAAAKAHRGSTGLTPVIRASRVRDGQAAQIQAALAGLPRAVAAAEALDVPAYFAARTARFDRAALAAERAALDALADIADLPVGATPDEPFTIEGRGVGVVLVLLTADAWQLPLHFGFGGGDFGVPSDLELAAVLRYWRRTHGAELMVIGGDYLELRTSQRLTTAELKTLAWQQFVFAPDIVTQGTGSVDKLAAALAPGYWFFWWD